MRDNPQNRLILLNPNLECNPRGVITKKTTIGFGVGGGVVRLAFCRVGGGDGFLPGGGGALVRLLSLKLCCHQT